MERLLQYILAGEEFSGVIKVAKLLLKLILKKFGNDAELIFDKIPEGKNLVIVGYRLAKAA